MSAPQPDGIWLVGCGNMAGAMLRQWIASGLDPARVFVVNRSDRALPPGVRQGRAFPADETPPALILLGMKPQQIDAIAPLPAPAEGAVLISILAGVEEAALARRFPGYAVVRAMPNLPVGIGKGVVALYSTTANPAQLATVEGLMAQLGLVELIGDETLFDAVTALSGCGPAFVYRFIDALAEAGAALGLPADQAERLALATVEGAGMLASGAEASPAVLADRVASPGGSTRQGLNVLDQDEALKRLLRATLKAAADRNAEMAAEARR